MLKPIDIHNAEFKRSFKGYNEQEVDAFLAKVVGEYEKMFRENKRLTDEVAALQKKLAASESKEQDIYALISLTKETVAEAKAISQKQANTVVENAQLEADRIVKDAEHEIERQKRRYVELKRQEKVFKERMRSLMETFWAMLEGGRDTADDPEVTKVYQEVSATDQDA